MNILSQALYSGISPSKILKTILKLHPEMANKVNHAIAAGYTTDQILKVVSGEGGDVGKGRGTYNPPEGGNVLLQTDRKREERIRKDRKMLMRLPPLLAGAAVYAISRSPYLADKATVFADEILSPKEYQKGKKSQEITNPIPQLPAPAPGIGYNPPGAGPPPPGGGPGAPPMQPPPQAPAPTGMFGPPGMLKQALSTPPGAFGNNMPSTLQRVMETMNVAQQMRGGPRGLPNYAPNAVSGGGMPVRPSAPSTGLEQLPSPLDAVQVERPNAPPIGQAFDIREMVQSLAQKGKNPRTIEQIVSKSLGKNAVANLMRDYDVNVGQMVNTYMKESAFTPQKAKAPEQPPIVQQAQGEEDIEDSHRVLAPKETKATSEKKKASPYNVRSPEEFKWPKKALAQKEESYRKIREAAKGKEVKTKEDAFNIMLDLFKQDPKGLPVLVGSHTGLFKPAILQDYDLDSGKANIINSSGNHEEVSLRDLSMQEDLAPKIVKEALGEAPIENKGHSEKPKEESFKFGDPILLPDGKQAQVLSVDHDKGMVTTHAKGQKRERTYAISDIKRDEATLKERAEKTKEYAKRQEERTQKFKPDGVKKPIDDSKPLQKGSYVFDTRGVYSPILNIEGDKAEIESSSGKKKWVPIKNLVPAPDKKDIDLDQIKVELQKGVALPSPEEVDSSVFFGTNYLREFEAVLAHFNNGSVYLYHGVPEDVYNEFHYGNAACKTEGENAYGSWWIGKDPSVGAAFHKFVKGKFPYDRLV